MQTDCIEELKELLAAWKLEKVLFHLIAEEISIEVLKVIKRGHIKQLLNKFSLGTQILFEHCLEQWRAKIGKPLKHNYHQDYPQIKNECERDDFNDISIKQHHNGFEEQTTINEESLQISNTGVDVKEILTECCPDGLELLKAYKKNHTFSIPERNHLINIIVNYYLEHNLPLNLSNSYQLENDILMLFPNEKLEMFRTDGQSKIYTKYLAAKTIYLRQKSTDDHEEDSGEEVLKLPKTENESDQEKYEHEFIEIEQNNSLLIAADNYEESTNVHETAAPTEIVLQALYRGCRKFIQIYEPFLYEDFFSAACSLFDIANKCDLYVAVNDFEILADDFKSAVLQYYKLPTFTIELKEKGISYIVTKSQDFEISHLEPVSPVQANTFAPAKLPDRNTIAGRNSSIQIINNYLPDVNDIRNIPALLPILKMSNDGKRLENKHRAAIAKTLIEECLNYQPERVLKRQEFIILAQNIVQAFPREVESTYFIPAQEKMHARGKLWNTYNNKRKMLTSSGVLDRRYRSNLKRLHQSNDDSERIYDKELLNDRTNDSRDFTISSAIDWEIMKVKWSETHQRRRNELLKENLSAHDYLEKYSILKTNRGIELMEIDVNILHPSVLDISNWLSLYQKIVDCVRKVRNEPIRKYLDCIDNSNDERYRSSIALLIIPYIFPYNAKRSDNATRCDIQNRFIKEYMSLEDLEADTGCLDLQLRFVHNDRQINYAEFNIAGQIFKCSDLWQALNAIFHYIIAMNLEYPKVCLYVWQFIQLAIFQVEMKDGVEPNVEIILNDLSLS